MTTPELVYKINLLLVEYGALRDDGSPVLKYYGWDLMFGPTWIMDGITPLPAGRVLFWLKKWGADVLEIQTEMDRL